MRNMMVVFFLYAIMPTVVVHGAEIRGWRTDGTGRYPQATPGIRWSAKENVAWATPMPAWSNSTPVITGNRLFVCAEQAELLCLDSKRGTILWQRSNGLDQLHGSPKGGMPKTHRTNGYSSPTPVTDGLQVFALFGNGVAAAYDLEGSRQWITRVGAPQHDWGHSASPALADGVLACLVHDSLVGLDATTGVEKWRLPADARWGSPIVVRIARTEIFLTPNGRFVRPSDGKVIDESLPKLDYSSPVVVGKVIYCIEGKSMAFTLPSSVRDKPKRLWTQRIKGSRHYASPLIHNGLIYTISREEHFTVLDAATGDIVYHKKFDVAGGNSAYPSPTLGGDHIYVGFEAGTTIVIEPGRTYREVARNHLEKYRSSPVFVKERMYLRTMGHLYCIVGPESMTRYEN